MQLIPSESCNPPPHPPLTHFRSAGGLEQKPLCGPNPKVDKFAIQQLTKKAADIRVTNPKHASPTVATRYPMRTAERQRGGGREDLAFFVSGHRVSSHWEPALRQNRCRARHDQELHDTYHVALRGSPLIIFNFSQNDESTQLR